MVLDWVALSRSVVSGSIWEHLGEREAADLEQFYSYTGSCAPLLAAGLQRGELWR